MVTLIDVGISPVLRVPQFIDARGVPNLYAFRDAFERWFGIPLNVTEGARSRPRQDTLWSAWRRYVRFGEPWAPRAAEPYTSIHDEVTRALAVDLGSGLAVASTPQAKWARANGPRFGVHPTGYGFGEPWHFDIRPGTETTTLAGSTGTQIEIEDDMPLNDDDKKWITQAIAAALGKSTNGYIIQSATSSVLLAPGFVRPLNSEEVGQAVGHYPIVSVGTNQRAFDVQVNLHRPAPFDISGIKAALGEALAALPAGTTSPTAAEIANELARRLSS